MKTIKCPPTWSGLMPAFLRILETGKESQKKAIRAELLDLAKMMDEVIKAQGIKIPRA